MPFLLRCWLITSIGEDPALARSRWLKEEGGASLVALLEEALELSIYSAEAL